MLDNHTSLSLNSSYNGDYFSGYTMNSSYNVDDVSGYTLNSSYSGDDISGYIVEGFLIPTLALPGILGNILCVWLFHKKDIELKPSFANLLKCLSVYDTLFLIGVLVQYSIPVHSEYYSSQILPRITPYSVPCLHIALTGSVYTVISLALERFITVCFPFNTCQMYDGMVYITLITGFSVLYNVNKMLELETVVATTSVSNLNEFGENITQIFEQFVLQPTPLRESEFYTKYIVFLLNFLVMGLLPVILLSVLNFCIYRSIAKATRNHNNISSDIRRDTAMAGLLTAIVVVFLLCHCPKVAVNLYEAIEKDRLMNYPTPTWLHIMIKINHLLLALNSAANILIYSYKDLRFRTVLLSSFKREQTLSSLRSSFKTSFGSRYRNRRNEVLQVTVSDSPDIRIRLQESL